ncbi:hypothetical protein C2845_PM06G14350 [Panicum miliaceum]|uniref:AIPP2-like SPOC-like domain-containing protein n=1 Tax=Panicum miliaceum TaxID=4540 RepID=A0A3L6R9S3_PANMI|nr:hypothetical protein C2845_PM06G14350 [Panicum miliaceum]
MVNRGEPSGKDFGPTRRKPTRHKVSKILKKSRKEYQKTKENMRVGPLPAKQYPSKNSNAGQLDARIVGKRNSKSNQVQPILSLKKHLISSEKQRTSTLSSSREDTDAALKKPRPLKKKVGVLEISPPTRLNAMPELAHKKTKRLKKQSKFDRGGAIIVRKGGTKKLEFSNNIELFVISKKSNTSMASKLLVPKNNYLDECKERQDGIVSSKGKCKDHASGGHDIHGALHKQEGTKSLNGNQPMQGLQRKSGKNSSKPFDKDHSRCHRDKALRKEDGHSPHNADQRGLTEINFDLSNKSEVAKCDGNTNNDMPKKRKVPSLEVIPKTIEVNVSKDLQGNNTDSRPRKKQRCVTSKDEEKGVEDGGGDFSPMGVEDDIARSLSQAAISKDGHAKVSMPLFVEQQCCSKPIDLPTWSGIFKIDGKEYISLAGHLSNKSCEKVWSLSRQLTPLVELKRLPRLEVWPKAWETSKPNDNNIGMYFFPLDMRQDNDMDQLIKEVIENDLVLRAIVGDVEMLIFPSILLPNRHRTFQRKHYLWGVFKPREDKGVVAEPLSAIGRFAHEVEKEKQQHVLDQQDEMILKMSTMNHLPAKDTQVEASHVKGPPNMGFDLKAPNEGTKAEAEAAPVATDAAASPANHGQIDPTCMGLPVGRLMGFVVRQTPKLEQLIQEMKREGVLVFAMEGDSLGAGSWPGNMATAVQK